MRMIMKVNVAVPSMTIVEKVSLNNVGIGAEKDGFIGLSEDLDAFFSSEKEFDEPLNRAIQNAKIKWGEGIIEYV